MGERGGQRRRLSLTFEGNPEKGGRTRRGPELPPSFRYSLRVELGGKEGSCRVRFLFSGAI